MGLTSAWSQITASPCWLDGTENSPFGGQNLPRKGRFPCQRGCLHWAGLCCSRELLEKLRWSKVHGGMRWDMVLPCCHGVGVSPGPLDCANAASKNAAGRKMQVVTAQVPVTLQRESVWLAQLSNKTFDSQGRGLGRRKSPGKCWVFTTKFAA